MPTIGNKRVTQLVELTSNEVIPEDLFLIIDVNANESKKIRVSELGVWLQSSGSFYAIRALLADTASYILGSNVDGLVASASYALSSSVSSFAQLSSQSLNAISASYSLTSSFALNSNSSASNTASYLIYQGFPNGTSSYALNALTSTAASTSSFLLYFGGNNGTSSYAITTQNVQHTILADTASYFNNSSTSSAVATASYAFFAQVSDPSNTASYLIFSPNNGTASYAMAAQSAAGIKEYGIFLADTQSAYQAQLDDVDVFWSAQNYARTPIEAFGTVVIPFTSSAPTNGTLYLSAIDRNTGFETVIDSTPINFVLSPTMGTWGNYDSGSIKTTFSLIGQPNLSGSYLIFVSSSNNIQLESTRTVRFDVASESDFLSAYSNTAFTFSVIPSSSVTFSFTSTDGGPFTDNLTGLLHTMSLNKQIFTLNAINQGIVVMNYFWTLTSVTASNFSDNLGFSQMSGIPNSLKYLSCSYCNFSSFYTFASSSLSVFDCNNNHVIALPNFPTSMSYIDCSSNSLTSLNLPISLSYLNCSNNFITSLPNTLPLGLNKFLADNNSIQSLPATLPDTIVTMSLNNNPSLLNLQLVGLPSQSAYISINNCIVNVFPSIPSGVLYLSSYSSSLFSLSIDNISANLVSNGMISGTLDVRGNGMISPTALSNMTILQSNGWVTLYDT